MHPERGWAGQGPLGCPQKDNWSKKKKKVPLSRTLVRASLGLAEGELSQQIGVDVTGQLGVSQRSTAHHVEHTANFRKELIKAMTKSSRSDDE